MAFFTNGVSSAILVIPVRLDSLTYETSGRRA
jgi:hypothetical protein